MEVAGSNPVLRSNDKGPVFLQEPPGSRALFFQGIPDHVDQLRGPAFCRHETGSRGSTARLTTLDPDKKPDTCTASQGDYTLEHMSSGSAEADRLIAALIRHHVAVTSTLPGLASTLDASVDGRPLLLPAALQAMSPSVREAYLYGRNRPASKSTQTKNALLLRRGMDLERAFVAAGGLLLAGADPVGNGGVIPGFGDQREIELLVEAGFAPVQAIRIATLNGATSSATRSRSARLRPGRTRISWW